MGFEQVALSRYTPRVQEKLITIETGLRNPGLPHNTAAPVDSESHKLGAAISSPGPQRDVCDAFKHRPARDNGHQLVAILRHPNGNPVPARRRKPYVNGVAVNRHV